MSNIFFSKYNVLENGSVSNYLKMGKKWKTLNVNSYYCFKVLALVSCITNIEKYVHQPQLIITTIIFFYIKLIIKTFWVYLTTLVVK